MTSVGLLAAGLGGGVLLGQDHKAQQRSAESQASVQVDVDDMQLLKQRQTEHAAARAWQREAEGDAAAKAASAAQDAAGKAHTLEQKVIAQKKADAAAADAAQKKAEEEAAAAAKSESSGPVAYTGDIPASCDEYSGAKATGCALMLDAGFKIDQFPCLEKLWDRESGWNYKATNSGSGAYGIPQALPGSKMASIADDWKTNPATQIKWGLGYIEDRYSSPCGAWDHSESTGWY